jgi:hypothetical protein
MKVRSTVVGRLLGLAAVAIVSVAPAAYSTAADSAGAIPSADTSGFAGPVTTHPQRLDTDLSSPRGELRRVRCAARLAGTTCWVARR